MAMRMAVMALRKAAEARMKTSSAIWPSSSRRLRKFRERSGSGASMGSNEILGGSVIVEKSKAPAKVRGRYNWRSFFLQRWWRIVGEFVFAGVGALDFELVEEQRRADHGGGDSAGAIADLRIVADGNEVAAQSANVEFAEDGAAHELFVGVGIDAIELARS